MQKYEVIIRERREGKVRGTCEYYDKTIGTYNNIHEARSVQSAIQQYTRDSVEISRK